MKMMMMVMILQMKKAEVVRSQVTWNQAPKVWIQALSVSSCFQLLYYFDAIEIIRLISDTNFLSIYNENV